MTDTNDDKSAELPDLDALEKNEQGLLRRLLDKDLEQGQWIFAISCRMGESTSYISSVPLKWFSGVKFPSALSIFDEYRDEQSESVRINKETINSLSQRRPDWSRQVGMTSYLAFRSHHKFPPVLLVAYQKWVFDSNSDNWVGGKATKDSVTRKNLDSRGWVVDIGHGGTDFYALDGQHRLMAVKGLRELTEDGSLPVKKKDGELKKNVVTMEKILEEHPNFRGVDKPTLREDINSIMEEQIGVEIIPAVLAGETKEEAFSRLRKIFVDVNQSAKRLERGELALLDEMDGFRIVGRQIMVSHKLFAHDDGLRVDTKLNQLTEKSEDYTTLQAIVGMARGYLKKHEPFNKWENIIGGIPNAGTLRPLDDEIEEGKEKLIAYFDAVATLPSHKKMLSGTNVSKLRSSQDGGYDNVLFRPIAQESLATAVGTLEKDKGMSIKSIFIKIQKKDSDKKSAFRLKDRTSPFFGIFCDPIDLKMRRQEKYKKIATDLFIHLLGGGISDKDEKEILRKKVFDSRRTTPEDSESPDASAINYNGKEVSYKDFQLPKPW